MNLTVQDFESYNTNCSIIKHIQQQIEGKSSFTVEELQSYSNHATLDRILEYLKPTRHQEFFDNYLKANAIEDIKTIQLASLNLNNKYSEYNYQINRLKDEIKRLSIFESGEELRKELIQLQDKVHYYQTQSKVFTVLYNVYHGKYLNSYRKTNKTMYNTLDCLIESMEFSSGDFNLINNNNIGAAYWLNQEHVYRTIIINQNNSACRDFENYYQRTPYILENNRMYEGKIFFADNIKYRCTGWNESNNIKLVTDNTDKQNRYCFDKKEFKAFFKDKLIKL